LLALRPCRASPQTLGDFTDFSKVGFTIATTAGKTITVKADRCGGSCSYAVVTVDGEEKFRSMTPDDELKAKVDAQQAADPAMMPYFFLQSDDYLTLKSRVLEYAERVLFFWYRLPAQCNHGVTQCGQPV
jgi:hypothetical protein